nr:MAG TPA: hypothetical protein [Caudoviricetes sp.]
MVHHHWQLKKQTLPLVPILLLHSPHCKDSTGIYPICHKAALTTQNGVCIIDLLFLTVSKEKEVLHAELR